MKYIMAIDAGTGSVRATLFDQQGNLINVSQRDWLHNEDPRYPGSMDFDTIRNWELIKAIMGECIKKSGVSPQNIAALGTASMREGFVLYDKDLNELFACANVDARASKEVEELQKIKTGIEKEIYHKSGQVFALGALPRLLWLKNNDPERYEKVAYINMLNDWIIFKLTGEMTVDPSNGCTTGMFDYKSREWSPEILKMCGLKHDIFPTVREGGEWIANVSPQASAETGLSLGTKIVAAGGDVQIGSVGVGLVKEKQCGVFGGSFWQAVINTDSPKTDEKCRVRLNCHAVPGLWQYEALAFFPGIVMRWYRNSFCQSEREAEKVLLIDAYDQMSEKAKNVPVGSNGVYPIFSDVMNFINWKHAAPSFINMSLDDEKCNKYVLFRALMENAALVTYGNVKLVEQFSGVKVDNVIFAGGGAKSGLWSQIVCDTLGVPVKVPVVKEATSIGAAMCGGVGSSLYANFEEAADQFVQLEKEYEPNLHNHKTYQDIYENWKKIYENQLKMADQGLTNHMWIAPGL